MINLPRFNGARASLWLIAIAVVAVCGTASIIYLHSQNQHNNGENTKSTTNNQALLDAQGKVAGVASSSATPNPTQIQATQSSNYTQAQTATHNVTGVHTSMPSSTPTQNSASVPKLIIPSPSATLTITPTQTPTIDPQQVLVAFCQDKQVSEIDPIRNQINSVDLKLSTVRQDVLRQSNGGLNEAQYEALVAQKTQDLNDQKANLQAQIQSVVEEYGQCSFVY